MPITQLQHRFVDGFPDRLQPGVLYISIEFASMSHLCCCGCGREVITPLSPKDWKFTYDGASVSVHPSIGNWSLPCRSHYIIQSVGLVIGATNKFRPADTVTRFPNEVRAIPPPALRRPCRHPKMSLLRTFVGVFGPHFGTNWSDRCRVSHRG